MADPRLKQAADLIKGGDKERAAQLLESIVEQNPRDANAWGWLYRASGSFERKEQCLEQILRLKPGDSRVQQELAKLRKKKERAEYIAYYGAPTETIPVPDIDPQPQSEEERQRNLSVWETNRPAPPQQEIAPQTAQPQQIAPVQIEPKPEKAPRKPRFSLGLILGRGWGNAFMAVMIAVMVMITVAVIEAPRVLGKVQSDINAVAPCEPGMCGDTLSMALTPMQDLVLEDPQRAQEAVMEMLASSSTWALDPASLQDPDNVDAFMAQANDIWTDAGFEQTAVDYMLGRFQPVMEAILEPVQVGMRNLMLIGFGVYAVTLLALGFLFVFLRAPANRLLHWFLATLISVAFNACMAVGSVWAFSNVLIPAFEPVIRSALSAVGV